MIQVIALFLLVSVELGVSTNPGIRARVSKKGIDYGFYFNVNIKSNKAKDSTDSVLAREEARYFGRKGISVESYHTTNDVAQRELEKEFQTFKIPNYSSKSGKTTIKLWDIETKSVDLPTSNVQLVPNGNGLSWSITNFSTSLHARYRAKTKILWSGMSLDGSVDVSVSQVNIKETVHLDRDIETDGPTLSHGSCSSNIGRVEVHVHGKWAWFINLFHGKVASYVKDLLKPKICDHVVKMIRGRVSPSLSLMNVTAELADHFYIDYSLVESPIVTSKHIDILYKGAVFAKSNLRNSPYSPQPIPSVGYDKHMVHFWITQYTFNTLLYQAHANGLLKCSVTKGKLPSFLDTTCDAVCIGKIMPQIGKLYPSSTVEVSMQSATMPEIKLTTDKCMVNLSVLMALRVRTSSDISTDLVSVNITLSMVFAPSVKYQRLTGYFHDYSLSVSDVNFVNGKILGTLRMLDDVLTKVFGLAVIPKLNALGDRGVNLPVSKTMRFTNTYLDVKQVMEFLEDIFYQFEANFKAGFRKFFGLFWKLLYKKKYFDSDTTG